MKKFALICFRLLQRFDSYVWLREKKSGSFSFYLGWFINNTLGMRILKYSRKTILDVDFRKSDKQEIEWLHKSKVLHFLKETHYEKVDGTILLWVMCLGHGLW